MKDKYYLFYEAPDFFGCKIHVFLDRYFLEKYLLKLKKQYRGNSEFAYFVIRGVNIKCKNVKVKELEED